MDWLKKVKEVITPIWKDYSDEHGLDPDPLSRRDLDLATIESLQFQWLIVIIAGLGFFVDGYLVGESDPCYGTIKTNSHGYQLFASNFALPIVDYVYWNSDTRSDHETAINITTLIGCMFGQVVFGILADRYGRRRLYGWELVILIVGSIGAALSAKGEGSMNIEALLIFWRAFVGIGVGAEYPTAAVITSEFAPTPFRARMIATVFAMQSIGQLFAAIVALIVSTYLINEDSMWRWIYGAGVIPAVVVLLFRVSIPESPRYTFDIKRNPKKANEDIKTIYRLARVFRRSSREEPNQDEHAGPQQLTRPAMSEPDFPPLPSVDDFWQYFFKQRNWLNLLATAGTWFILDLSFYGLGLNSPQIISRLYNESSTKNCTVPSTAQNSTSIWASEPLCPHLNSFRDNATHSMAVVSTGAVLGSLILVWLVDHVSRKRLQIAGFFLLGSLFIVIGGLWSSTYQRVNSSVSVAVLYGICQFLFNLGPNGLTFMFPAEIFPTRYRCTCHGISAAAGKLGSVVAQAALGGTPFYGTGETRMLGNVLIGFGCAMFIGAALSFLLPEVQGARYTSKSLESLAKGRLGDGSRDQFPLEEGSSHPLANPGDEVAASQIPDDSADGQ